MFSLLSSDVSLSPNQLRVHLSSSSSSSSELERETKKTMKSRKRNQEELVSTNLVDRLSILPQEILLHIFSFDVDVKQVVQMSILSNKWRYFWKSLVSLSFNSNVFYNHQTCIPVDGQNHIIFNNFVTQVLGNGGSSKNICKLKVFSSGCSKKCDISSYVGIAVRRNVQELRLSFDKPIFRKLDLRGSSVFSCRTLTSLVLELDINGKEDCVQLCLPGLIDMPVLRNLKLQFIAMLSTEFFGKFFSGCPVLERLKFSNCEFDESKGDLVISGVQLKYLVIEECLPEDDFCGQRIIISAPNLISFRCVDYMLNDYCFEDLSCLQTADIDISASFTDDDADESYFGFEADEAKRMLGVLKGLYNVKSLTLAPRVLQVSRAQDMLKRSSVPFDNLKYLEVTWISEEHLQGIKYILENSQSIETFVIGSIGRKSPLATIPEYWGQQFMLQCLKCIKIRYVTRSNDELEFLKIFLKTAVSLEKVILFTVKEVSASSEERKIFVEEILMSPRASSNVEILEI